MMKQFDDEQGKRRLLNIFNMKEEDAECFFMHYTRLPQELKKQCTRELREQIIQSREETEYLEWILAICLENGKLIGKIEVTAPNMEDATLRIDIPNENWTLKYGPEALDQFIKICKENHYFKTVELESSCITKNYIKTHGLKSKIIEVA